MVQVESEQFQKRLCSSNTPFATNMAQTYVLKRFITSAIYVETSTSHNEDTPIYRKAHSAGKTFIMKKCVCAIDFMNCPCHPRMSDELDTNRGSNSSSNSPESDSSHVSTTTISTVPSKSTVVQNTMAPKSSHSSDLKLSATPCLSTFRLDEDNPTIRDWVDRKNEETRKRLAIEAKIKRERVIERQRTIERERENFKKWLVAKKKEEEQKNAEKERLAKIEKIKQVEKEKRRLENQIKFEVWCRKKEELEIERKVQQELSALQIKIESEQRMKKNQKAFNDWMRNSRYKARPVPLNQGLDSLRPTYSVTAINPNPWVPNISPRKPHSQ